MPRLPSSTSTMRPEVAMDAPKRRPCRYCRRWFRQDARVGSRQYACSRDECQARRQRANEDARLERDPACWRGRAAKHRAYREAHPGIDRRRHEPEAAERDRVARRARHGLARVRRAAEHKAIALQLIPAQEDGARVSRAAEHKEICAQAAVLLGLVEALSPAAAHQQIDVALQEFHDRGWRLLGGGGGDERARTSREARA